MELTRPSKSAAILKKLKLSVQVRAGNIATMTPSKFLLKENMRMEMKANSFDARILENELKVLGERPSGFYDFQLFLYLSISETRGKPCYFNV